MSGTAASKGTGWGANLGAGDLLLDAPARPAGPGPAPAPFGAGGKGDAEGFRVARTEEPGRGRSGARSVRIGRRDLESFFSQLAILLEAGVPIVPSIQSLASQARTPVFRRLLTDVEGDLLEGTAFSGALEKRPGAFPAIAVHMARVGESSGTLPASLRRTATFLEAQAEIVSRVRAALAYPVIMLVLSTGVVIFMLTFILPRFQIFFQGKEHAIPWSTRFLLWSSELLTTRALHLLPGLAVLGGALFASLRTEGGQRRLDALKLRLPVLGALFQRTAVARSVGALSVLLRGGVPVLEALTIVRRIAGNRLYGDLWLQVAERVRDGGRIHEALEGSPLVPGPLIRMVSVGEEAGILEEVLEKASEYYQAQVQRAVKEVATLLEPLMVIVVGGIVGFIAISLMLPIFTLSRTLR